MRLSELRSQLAAAGDLDSFEAYLAAPDKDGTDVDLASVGRVEIDRGKAEARLYPASTRSDVDSVDPEPFLGMVMDQLPDDDADASDLRLVAETPLLRNEGDDPAVALVEITALHIGRTCREAWFLLEPASAFPPGVLPG